MHFKGEWTKKLINANSSIIHTSPVPSLLSWFKSWYDHDREHSCHFAEKRICSCVQPFCLVESLPGFPPSPFALSFCCSPNEPIFGSQVWTCIRVCATEDVSADKPIWRAKTDRIFLKHTWGPTKRPQFPPDGAQVRACACILLSACRANNGSPFRSARSRNDKSYKS